MKSKLFSTFNPTKKNPKKIQFNSFHHKIIKVSISPNKKTNIPSNFWNNKNHKMKNFINEMFG